MLRLWALNLNLQLNKVKGHLASRRLGEKVQWKYKTCTHNLTHTHTHPYCFCVRERRRRRSSTAHFLFLFLKGDISGQPVTSRFTYKTSLNMTQNKLSLTQTQTHTHTCTSSLRTETHSQAVGAKRNSFLGWGQCLDKARWYDLCFSKHPLVTNASLYLTSPDKRRQETIHWDT